MNQDMSGLKHIGKARQETSPELKTERRTILRIGGMDCPSCASKVERVLLRCEGVEAASVSLMAETAQVTLRDNVALETAMAAVRKLGFDVALDTRSNVEADAGERRKHDHGHDHEAVESRETAQVWWRSAKVRQVAIYAATLAVAVALGRVFPALERWLLLAALAFGLLPIVRSAIALILSGTWFSIESLMSVAAIGAVLIGDVIEAAVVVLLFLVGEVLENLAARSARSSIEGLKNLTPSRALIEGLDGSTREVAAETLRPGNTILARPGDRIAADGEIVSGESALDEASITGESMPRHRGIGETVFAGTINLDGVIRVRVTALPQDNTIARVVRLVTEAQEAKAPTQRVIDRFAFYYTPFVALVGLLAAVVPPLFFGAPWETWIYRGLALLLIGCPCALVISTPAAIVSGLATGARYGLLIKGGGILETVGRITVAAFDKTGTLTSGKAMVTDVVPFACPERNSLAIAAGLETGSNHPLAEAIRRASQAKGIAPVTVTDIDVVIGRGVGGTYDGQKVFFGAETVATGRIQLSPAAQSAIATLRGDGKTVSLLTIGNDLAAIVALRDEPREDAAEGIVALQRFGIRCVMLTGDNRRTAQAVAKTLGLEVQADLLPQDKQKAIRELQVQGAVVAKVGDGVNDAPGLAAADVGIAMGGATDVALETADAAILHGRVRDVARLVDLSRRTLGTIRQNIAIAIGLKVVFLVTTLVGVTGLWPAILADTGATVIVTVNSLRLLRAKLGA